MSATRPPRTVEQILETGSAWITESELDRLCKRLMALEQAAGELCERLQDAMPDGHRVHSDAINPYNWEACFECRRLGVADLNAARVLLGQKEGGR